MRGAVTPAPAVLLVDAGDAGAAAAEAFTHLPVWQTSPPLQSASFLHVAAAAGFAESSADWRGDLSWVGRDGLLVFERCELGEEQEHLRREGFHLIGWGALGERLECDRAFGQGALREAGLQTAPTHDFADFDAGISFV